MTPMLMRPPAASSFRLLRVRLPLLITAVVITVLATFLGFAYRAVERVSVGATGDRAQGAADQLATLMAQSTQQRVTEIRRVAAMPAVSQPAERKEKQLLNRQIGTGDLKMAGNI